ncbi:HD domain-containing protein [Candidatus Woesearchaeota archaeon]|nr:HD domain-containing protein [Candidatus Woesearchaeota archaeon]
MSSIKEIARWMGRNSVKIEETPLAFVFFTDEHVFKVYKPKKIDGVVDNSTLKKRKHNLANELQINKLLCKNIYLKVVPIVKTNTGFSFEARGDIVDYALKMLQLPRDRSLNYALENKWTIRKETLKDILLLLSNFHKKAATNDRISNFGKIQDLWSLYESHLEKIERFQKPDLLFNDSVKDFVIQKSDLFFERVKNNKIKDIHGDVRAENIFVVDNNIYLIDRVAFNDSFRYRDVLFDVAYLAMDLDFHGKHELSKYFVKQYMLLNGEPEESLELIQFYKSYCAIIQCLNHYISKQKSFAVDYFNLAKSYFREELDLLYEGPEVKFRIDYAGNRKLQRLIDNCSASGELKTLLLCSNIMAIDRLKHHDHGKTHATKTANFALKMLRVLKDKKIKFSLLNDYVYNKYIKSYDFSYDDVEVIVALASILHDIGTSIDKKNHSLLGVNLALQLIDSLLENIYKVNEKTIIKSEVMHCILMHVTDSAPLTVEAGLVKIADALDMEEGRAKISFREGMIDTHSVSALAIKKVLISSSFRKPIVITVLMSNSAGLFQVKDMLQAKVQKSGIEKYIEVVTKIDKSAKAEEVPDKLIFKKNEIKRDFRRK